MALAWTDPAPAMTQISGRYQRVLLPAVVQAKPPPSPWGESVPSVARLHAARCSVSPNSPPVIAIAARRRQQVAPEAEQVFALEGWPGSCSVGSYIANTAGGVGRAAPAAVTSFQKCVRPAAVTEIRAHGFVQRLAVSPEVRIENRPHFVIKPGKRDGKNTCTAHRPNLAGPSPPGCGTRCRRIEGSERRPSSGESNASGRRSPGVERRLASARPMAADNARVSEGGAGWMLVSGLIQMQFCPNRSAAPPAFGQSPPIMRAKRSNPLFFAWRLWMRRASAPRQERGKHLRPPPSPGN